MKKKIIIIVSIIFLILLCLGLSFYFFLYKVNIKNISYKLNKDTIIANIKFNNLYINGFCEINGNKVAIINKECDITIPNTNTDVYIINDFHKEKFKFNPNQNEIIDFEIENKIYLVVGEEKKIDVNINSIGNPDKSLDIKSNDENIVKVDGYSLIGIGKGNTKVVVKVGKIEKEIEVIVTDLAVLPKLDNNKKYLSCNIYSDEDNKILDELLEYRVNTAGYKTRGAVVAAARFLTLEFPYKLSYFWENGRLNNNTGGPKADGEGRFYHKGLYLSSSKFNDLDKSLIRFGPATWGCPLTNWEDKPRAGFIRGQKVPNGLDCSGFVTWVLYNAGFDPKDSGAGDTPSVSDDLGDFGPHQKITMELLESGTIKPGDYIASDGHAALVGGIDINNKKLYVAESTTYWRGVVMHEYNFKDLINYNHLNYIINMDDYYKEEGNYTYFWE